MPTHRYISKEDWRRAGTVIRDARACLGVNAVAELVDHLTPKPIGDHKLLIQLQGDVVVDHTHQSQGVALMTTAHVAVLANRPLKHQLDNGPAAGIVTQRDSMPLCVAGGQKECHFEPIEERLASGEAYVAGSDPVRREREVAVVRSRLLNREVKFRRALGEKRLEQPVFAAKEVVEGRFCDPRRGSDLLHANRLVTPGSE